MQRRGSADEGRERHDGDKSRSLLKSSGGTAHVRATPFDRYPWLYDRWYDENPHIYQAEVRALEQYVPWRGSGLEVGVGTARFAAPLQIEVGVDISPAMVRIARERGVEAVVGAAEALPFCDRVFDFVLMVTVVCFIEDTLAAFREVRRILKEGGSLTLGIIDRESPLGRQYLRERAESIFFRDAVFYSTGEVESLLEKAGFLDREVVQTVFEGFPDAPSGFVVIHACKDTREAAPIDT
ncbi:MAG: methyltransferase domain-containing protein [Methanomicrobiales archaeon]|nr:methyltransferase domain-containing protein [Methanomicrobiales archaeon]MDI6876401.1 methyltransferase domain-containing protein [Methanomicrobiales archaeon]